VITATRKAFDAAVAKRVGSTDRVTITPTNRGNVVRVNGAEVVTFQDGTAADRFVDRHLSTAEVIWL
jgi:hypothetical protein